MKEEEELFLKMIEEEEELLNRLEANMDPEEN